MKEFIDISDKEIEILKYRQHTDISHQAHNQKHLSSGSMCIFNHDPCYVINNDRENEYENIYRYKKHVKNTTCYKQVHPPETMWQYKIQQGNNRKKQ